MGYCIWLDSSLCPFFIEDNFLEIFLQQDILSWLESRNISPSLVAARHLFLFSIFYEAADLDGVLESSHSEALPWDNLCWLLVVSCIWCLWRCQRRIPILVTWATWAADNLTLLSCILELAFPDRALFLWYVRGYHVADWVCSVWPAVECYQQNVTMHNASISVLRIGTGSRSLRSG